MTQFTKKVFAFRACAIAFVASLAVLVTVDSVAAQSLFQRRSARQVGKFLDPVAKRRGDLLMVVVNENTNLENRDERSMDKTGNSTGNATFGYGFGGGLGTGEASGDINHQTSMQRGFSGDSEFRSQRRFLDQFSVMVTDVYPNGNMRVVGYRSINIQGDSRQLQLSGIVRFVDVLPNNTVASQLIANLKIELVGRGPEQKFGKQGILARKLNRIWPF